MIVAAVSILLAMKIVHLLLTHSFAGTERYVVELANAQARDHDVTVVLHKRAAETRANAIAHRFDAGVDVKLVGGWKFLAIWTARRLLKSLTADVVHAHLSGACRALHGINRRFLRVATLHIHYKPQQHADIDALIAIAPWQLDDIPESQRSKTAQIDNWTNAGPADPQARQLIRAQLGVRDDEFLIGALGRVESSKGLDVLVHAYQQAQTQGVRLVIVGHGRDWNALRRLAPASVAMPGFVERPQDWFSAFDAFVSAAHSEPFGLVFLEAMASGLPVLATATQGAQHFRSMFERALVPPGDAKALAKALSDLISERPPRRSYDLTAFSRDAKVAEIESFYQRSRQRLGLE